MKNEKLIVFYYKNSLKVVEIAEKLGLTIGYVYKVLHRERIYNYRKSTDNALYSSEKYIFWRNAVLKRDGYKCIKCEKPKGKGVVLQVDHIIPKTTNPELMFETSNGRTLCLSCHKKTTTYGSKGIKNYIKNKTND